ncbi:unnamed protein product, partial [Didymodactylos carnosus]
ASPTEDGEEQERQQIEEIYNQTGGEPLNRGFFLIFQQIFALIIKRLKVFCRQWI